MPTRCRLLREMYVPDHHRTSIGCNPDDVAGAVAIPIRKVQVFAIYVFWGRPESALFEMSAAVQFEFSESRSDTGPKVSAPRTIGDKKKEKCADVVVPISIRIRVTYRALATVDPQLHGPE